MVGGVASVPRAALSDLSRRRTEVSARGRLLLRRAGYFTRDLGWRLGHLLRRLSGSEDGYRLRMADRFRSQLSARGLDAWSAEIHAPLRSDVVAAPLLIPLGACSRELLGHRPVELGAAVRSFDRAPRGHALRLELSGDLGTHLLGWDVSAEGRVARAYEARVRLDGRALGLRLCGVALDRSGSPVAVLLAPVS